MDLGVQAVAPTMANLEGGWIKTLSGTGPSTVGMSADSTYVLSGDGLTLTITSFNAGPSGTRRFFLTETGWGWYLYI